MKDHVEQIQGLSMFSAAAEITEVPAGIVNHAYRVSQDGESFLVKFLPNRDVGQTPRKAIFSLQQQLAESQLAVKPLFYDQDAEIWVEHWCDYPVFSESDVRNDVAISHLASTLSVIHQTEAQCPGLDIASAWQHYLTKVPAARLDGLKAQVDTLTPKLHKLTQRQPVLCHHDLSMGHLAQAPHRIVFDWEYAGKGDRYFDLASTILVNRMSSDIADQFIRAYATASGLSAEQVSENVALIEPCVSLTYLLWMMAEPHRATR